MPKTNCDDCAAEYPADDCNPWEVIVKVDGEELHLCREHFKARQMPGRVEILTRANASAALSRVPGAPVLAVDSSLETLCAWLQWNDPNGCHTAEAQEAEDIDPYTLDEAWEAIGHMVDP